MKYNGLNMYIDKLEKCEMYPCHYCQEDKYTLYSSMLARSIYNNELNKILMTSWFNGSQFISHNKMMNCFKRIFNKHNNFNVSYTRKIFNRFYKGIF